MAPAPPHDGQPAFDAPDGFALRIKHKKHILCVPVYPKTTYTDLAGLCLDLLDNAGLEAPQCTGTSSFDDLEAKDVAFFNGVYGPVAGGAATNLGTDEIRFVEIDRKKKATVSAMGLKDGPDAVVYLGFLNKSRGTYNDPDVTIASHKDEELDSGEAAMTLDEDKGKAVI